MYHSHSSVYLFCPAFYTSYIDERSLRFLPVIMLLGFKCDVCGGVRNSAVFVFIILLNISMTFNLFLVFYCVPSV